MSQMGADLEQLAALREVLLRQSNVIEELTATLRSQLSGTSWHGPAADRFRGAWTSDFEPTLRRLQGRSRKPPWPPAVASLLLLDPVHRAASGSRGANASPAA